MQICSRTHSKAVSCPFSIPLGKYWASIVLFMHKVLMAYGWSYEPYHKFSSKPLQIWSAKVRNGHIKRITDNDVQALVLEICGTNVSTTFITCPADSRKTLGIKLPFLVMIVKNVRVLIRVSCMDTSTLLRYLFAFFHVFSIQFAHFTYIAQKVFHFRGASLGW